MIPALVLSPFVIAPFAVWFVRSRPSWASLLAIWPALLTLVLADTWRAVIASGPLLAELAWAPSLGLSLSFYLDGLGLFFALLITAVGTLVVAYAGAYLRGHQDAGRFYASLLAFMGAMLGVVLSDNLLTLFVFWELTGFTSFLLIGFEHDKADARGAAVQALIVTGAGGLALLAAAILLGEAAGTLSLSASLAGGPLLQSHALYTPIAVLVLLAAFTKSAQAPFHFWLPSAMAAPTPVSAYLHSATMVKAGVYLVARMTPLLGGTPLWTTTLVAVGAVTMAGGAWRAVQETDLKRILAYSTVSALGVLMLLLGIGTREAVVAALVYLLAHAGYKGALFLVAGVIDHETGSRDVTVLRGLRRAMPWTTAAGVLAAASMAGIPLFLGFVGKELLYESVLGGGSRAAWGLVIVVAGSVLLGVAGLTAGVSPFFGRRGASSLPAHEAPALLWLPPLMLACAGLVVGLVPALLDLPIGSAAASVLRGSASVHLAVWHGITPMLALSGLTLAAIGAMYMVRDGWRAHAWPPALRLERLYTGTLAGLDGVSGVIAPPLQSASLRSYVLTVILAAGTLIGAGLAIGSGTQTFRIATSIQIHEAIIVAVIVSAALMAALTTSTMTAVLSLGTVGYGVALMFLSFGAPDLAMTQFSVETLTAVIFVLVFRHFPRLGVLSPWLVRARDVLVATAVGALIAALVLFVGTSGTPSRLAGYFVANGPELAHGRNIVNVILVDFRAFDTFGEITVLVTAAIGVRALLRIASGRLRPGAGDRPAAREESRS